MNLEKKVLQRYRQFFPQDNLRETSERTGIQITRVFRLLNGKSMKVSEFEAFEKAIQSKLQQSSHFSQLTDVLEKASAVLTNSELEKLIEKVERKTMARSYGRFYISTNHQDINIA